ncbi:MAG: glycosyltransferase family 4 protein [Acidobacteriota bacterium]
MVKVGIVVQRYGEDVVGGAETLSRDVAERLNSSGFDVTVFTTTAKDYITWDNHYKPGESILKGVIIKRFSVDYPRDIESFNDLSGKFFDKSNPEKEITEDEWIDLQGPVSDSLIRTIEDEQEDFDVFIFFTYLYFTTVKVMRVIRKPVFLFPTAHEEPPINMEIMKEVFSKPDVLFFLTGSEMDMVEKKFSPRGKTVLARTGVETGKESDENLFRRNFRIVSPFILYAGRIEKGKGLELLFEAFLKMRKTSVVDLVLMGRKLMEIPEADGIKYVGFVSEEDKASAFKGAVCSVQPSPLESLSITTLESFAQNTPVLVNADCSVLMEHIDASGGGLSFNNAEQFIENFNKIYKNKLTGERMGKAGYDYVKEFYSWDIVIKKISDQIREILKR